MLDDVSLDWADESGRSSFDEACTLFDRVFADPPYSWTDAQSARHRAAVASRARQAGFKLIAVRTADGLIGVAYGFPADEQWWHGVGTVRGSEGDTFTVSGIAVDARWRRHGVGRRLLEQLLDDCELPQAAVAVHPEATTAQRFYLSLGWRAVGRKQLPVTAPIEYLEIYSTAAPTR